MSKNLKDGAPGPRLARSMWRWKLTPVMRRQAEAMLRYRKGYLFVSNVVRNLAIGHSAFCRHFPKKRTRELRG